MKRLSLNFLQIQYRKELQPILPTIFQYYTNIYFYSVQGNGITNSEMDTVRQLFQENNLSLDNLQVYRIMYTKDYYEVIHISVNQFVGNLLVFYGDMSFHFRKINGVYTIDSLGISGHRIHTGQINPNYKITPLHAANVLYQKMIKDLEIGGWNANWRDSCYSTTLGVFQTNNTSNGQPPKYELAWRVTPLNFNYPICFVNAMTGKLIYYFNGMLY